MARPTDPSPDDVAARDAFSPTTSSPTTSSPETSSPDTATLTYEQARDELVGVVERLETGAATLEESLALWERGEALAARCQQWLDGARERLEAARREGAGAADGAAS